MKNKKKSWGAWPRIPFENIHYSDSICDRVLTGKGYKSEFNVIAQIDNGKDLF